ncbi:PREDICTED: SUN domain-containing protein 3-like [Tinamus guttatus]|uniref:SUN domain-containing protein 3-like n=1 Tax=Tinamus guttatus TaxID=94827 RepID=UPI00052F1C04|nr:PREDICTED: SUN domain-containing protein 3-like [Tinamus guttatus]
MEGKEAGSRAATVHIREGCLSRSGMEIIDRGERLCCLSEDGSAVCVTENQPGNCWSFSGSQGHVFIKLSKAISPHAVTLEHIAVRVSPRGDISSAPKDFAVYGMKAENEEQGLFLGEFTYSPAEHPFQTFWLQNEGWDSVRYVKLEVLSNWGHPEYTCLYRVRVHGQEP